MAAPVMYTRDDVGSPLLSYGSGSNVVSSQTWMTNMRAILRACLITGYGSKPAAGGWTIESESTNHLLLRNGPGSGYVFFRLLENGARNCIEVFLAQTVTAVVDTGYGKAITGTGIKSGLLPMPSNEYANYSQRMSAWGVYTNAINTNWMLVADDKTFVFLLSSSEAGTLVPITLSERYAMLSLYVGEDTAGNFISVGGLNSTRVENGLVHTFRIETSVDAAGVTILKNPQTGELLTSATVMPLCPALFPAPIWAEEYSADRLTLGKLPWLLKNSSGAPYVFCGNLRGIAWANELALNYRFDFNLKAMGWTGAAATFRTNPKLPLDDTYDYRLMFVFRNSAQGALMTDNPEFW